MEDFYGKNFKKSKKIFPGFYFNFFGRGGAEKYSVKEFFFNENFFGIFFAGLLCSKRANRCNTHLLLM